jgi:hypothetical protein
MKSQEGLSRKPKKITFRHIKLQPIYDGPFDLISAKILELEGPVISVCCSSCRLETPAKILIMKQ